MLFSIWRDLWYAHAVKSKGKDKGRLVDAIYDIREPQRLLEFTTEFKHSVTVEIYKRPARKRGMPRFQAPRPILVATYEVDTRTLTVMGEFDLLKK